MEPKRNNLQRATFTSHPPNVFGYVRVEIQYMNRILSVHLIETFAGEPIMVDACEQADYSLNIQTRKGERTYAQLILPLDSSGAPYNLEHLKVFIGDPQSIAPWTYGQWWNKAVDYIRDSDDPSAKMLAEKLNSLVG